MRVVLPIVAFIAAFAVVASALPADRALAVGPCAADTSLDGEELEFLDLINEYRVQNGLGPLVFSDALNQAAAWKSAHMANNDYFAHDDAIINRGFVERLRDCGYGANTWLAENIAAGNDTAEETFEQWRESAGHNSNMLNPNMAAIGVARVFNDDSTYGWYWTTEFGGESDEIVPPATPVPPPASALEKSGDVDCTGATTSVDAALVLQLSAALIPDLPCQGEADVSGDNRVSSLDAAIILQISAGLIG